MGNVGFTENDLLIIEVNSSNFNTFQLKIKKKPWTMKNP